MTDVTQETRFVASRTTLLLIGLCLFLVSGLFLALIWPLPANVVSWSFTQIVQLAAMAIFALAGGFYLTNGLVRTPPTLLLSPSGFHYTLASSKMIPWSAVSHVREFSSRGTSVVIIEVTREAWQSAGMTYLARFTRPNFGLGTTCGVWIAPIAVSTKFDELRDAVFEYSNAHR